MCPCGEIHTDNEHTHVHTGAHPGYRVRFWTKNPENQTLQKDRWIRYLWNACKNSRNHRGWLMQLILLMLPDWLSSLIKVNSTCVPIVFLVLFTRRLPKYHIPSEQLYYAPNKINFRKWRKYIIGEICFIYITAEYVSCKLYFIYKYFRVRHHRKVFYFIIMWANMCQVLFVLDTKCFNILTPTLPTSILWGCVSIIPVHRQEYPQWG